MSDSHPYHQFFLSMMVVVLVLSGITPYLSFAGVAQAETTSTVEPEVRVTTFQVYPDEVQPTDRVTISFTLSNTYSQPITDETIKIYDNGEVIKQAKTPTGETVDPTITFTNNNPLKSGERKTYTFTYKVPYKTDGYSLDNLPTKHVISLSKQKVSGEESAEVIKMVQKDAGVFSVNLQSSSSSYRLTKKPVSFFKDGDSNKEVGESYRIPPIKVKDNGEIVYQPSKLSDDVLAGNVEDFTYASSAVKTGMTVSSSGPLSIGFKSTNLLTGGEYAFTVRYNFKEGSGPVRLEVVNSKGEEINPKTNYYISGGEFNSRTFVLSKAEQQYVKEHNTLYLQMKSDSSIEKLKIYYMSVVASDHQLNLGGNVMAVTKQFKVTDKHIQLPDDEPKTTVIVTVNNPTDKVITEPITLMVDGKVKDSRLVQLKPGQTRKVEMVWKLPPFKKVGTTKVYDVGEEPPSNDWEKVLIEDPTKETCRPQNDFVHHCEQYTGSRHDYNSPGEGWEKGKKLGEEKVLTDQTKISSEEPNPEKKWEKIEKVGTSTTNDVDYQTLKGYESGWRDWYGHPYSPSEMSAEFHDRIYKEYYYGELSWFYEGYPFENYKEWELPADNYAWKYEGWVYAPESGRYRFAVNSDDAADVIIDGKKVASWYGGHGIDYWGIGQTGGEVLLEKGWHKMKVRMEEEQGGDGVEVRWQKPDESDWDLITSGGGKIIEGSNDVEKRDIVSSKGSTTTVTNNLFYDGFEGSTEGWYTPDDGGWWESASLRSNSGWLTTECSGDVNSDTYIKNIGDTNAVAIKYDLKTAAIDSWDGENYRFMVKDSAGWHVVERYTETSEFGDGGWWSTYDGNSAYDCASENSWGEDTDSRSGKYQITGEVKAFKFEMDKDQDNYDESLGMEYIDVDVVQKTTSGSSSKKRFIDVNDKQSYENTDTYNAISISGEPSKVRVYLRASSDWEGDDSYSYNHGGTSGEIYATITDGSHSKKITMFESSEWADPDGDAYLNIDGTANQWKYALVDIPKNWNEKKLKVIPSATAQSWWYGSKWTMLDGTMRAEGVTTTYKWQKYKYKDVYNWTKDYNVLHYRWMDKRFSSKTYSLDIKGTPQYESVEVTYSKSSTEDYNELPEAKINGDTKIQAGESTTLSGLESFDEDGRITEYKWEIDGQTWYGSTFEKTYYKEGIYVVKLTVTDNDGGTDTEYVTVEVN